MQRDGRRAVGDRVEGPGQIAAETPRKVAEPSLLIVKRRSSVPAGSAACASVGAALEAALAHDVEVHLAGRSGPRAALPAGTATGARRLRGLARAQPGKHDRRPAGIVRRRDPGVDAEIRRRHHALPVEGGGDALPALAAGGKEGRDRPGCSTSARSAIGSRSAQPRRRPAGLELARRQQRALDMGVPERLRDRIVAVGGDLVGDRGRRPMRLAAVAVEPAQAVGDAAAAAASASGAAATAVTTTNDDQADGARERRQHQPQAGPGKRQEQSERGRQDGASAGHSRSHNRLPRARSSARASRRPASACSQLSFGCSSKPSKSRSVARGSGNSLSHAGHHAGQIPRAMRAVLVRLEPVRQAIERDQLVDFEARPHQRPFARR